MFKDWRGNGKKLSEGELGDNSPASYRVTILNLKRTISRKLKWSLYEIDETDICNLLAFIQFKIDDDPNVKVINGKAYHRATGIPDWL